MMPMTTESNQHIRKPNTQLRPILKARTPPFDRPDSSNKLRADKETPGFRWLYARIPKNKIPIQQSAPNKPNPMLINQPTVCTMVNLGPNSFLDPPAHPLAGLNLPSKRLGLTV